MGAGAPFSFVRGVSSIPGAGSPYSFVRGVAFFPGAGASYSFVRGAVIVPGVGSPYSFINTPGPRNVGIGPVFQGVANTLRLSGVGPIFHGRADQSREFGVGPVFQGKAVALRISGIGPVFQGLANQIVTIIPPVTVIPTDCAPLAPITQAIDFRQVNFGDPEPQEPEDSLNKLTPIQFRFIQKRNAGSDGSLVLGRFTGPAYPFGPRWADTLGPKPDLNVIFTSVVNILTTPLGSLPYAPGIGSPIPLLVFEINDAITQGLIKRFTQDNLRDQEPRARVLFVRTIVPVNDPNRVVVTVAFQIVGDPERRVYTAPIQFNTLSLAL